MRRRVTAVASAVVAVMVLTAFVVAADAGSCLEAKLCCPGRDSACVVQKTPINAIIEDPTDKPCYCDHACLKLGDCCADFKPACGGKCLKHRLLHSPIVICTRPSPILTNNCHHHFVTRGTQPRIYGSGRGLPGVYWFYIIAPCRRTAGTVNPMVFFPYRFN